MRVSRSWTDACSTAPGVAVPKSAAVKTSDTFVPNSGDVTGSRRGRGPVVGPSFDRGLSHAIEPDCDFAVAEGVRRFPQGPIRGTIVGTI
jgi:hypothetical protein